MIKKLFSLDNNGQESAKRRNDRECLYTSAIKTAVNLPEVQKYSADEANEPYPDQHLQKYSRLLLN